MPDKPATMELHIKRAYAPAGPEDGERYLVDRLWPRGVKKATLVLTGWLKGVAPSDALRRWFGHDPARWTAFRRRYGDELKSQRKALQPLRGALKRGPVTLVYSALDEAIKHMVAVFSRFADPYFRERGADLRDVGKLLLSREANRAALRVLATLATVAKANGKPICLCGEIASDPAYTTLLLGLGFRSFSVSPGRLLEIKHAIRSTRLFEAEELAGKVLPLDSTRDIKAYLKDDWSRRSPVSSPTIPASAPATTAPLPVTHNVELQRFELQAGDAPLAFLSYTHEGERVVLDHTFVPDDLRGQGIAGALARAALNEARQRRWRIVPRCSYVATFIKRNPDFADLVARPERA